MKDLMSNISKIVLVATLVVSFGAFIYGISEYFGKAPIVVINSYNTPWTKTVSSADPITKVLQETINSSFNQQKDIFSLLITITSLGIFIISLLTSLSVSEKTRLIDKYFEDLKAAPEKLVRVFYDEIVQKVKGQVRTGSNDQALVENLRFLAASPTIYEGDFELFQECYEHFERRIRRFRANGIFFSSKLMTQANQAAALTRIKADLVASHHDDEYMNAAITAVAELLDLEFVVENLVNTNYLQVPLVGLIRSHEVSDKDLLRIVDKSTGHFVPANVNFVAYWARQKDKVVDKLIEKKIPIPTTIFNELKLFSDSDIGFVDKVFCAADWPDWLQEKTAEDILNDNYSFSNVFDKKVIDGLKSEIFKKWMKLRNKDT